MHNSPVNSEVLDPAAADRKEDERVKVSQPDRVGGERRRRGSTRHALAGRYEVDRIRIAVFAVAGLLAALAGLMTAGQVDAVTANQGNNLIFTVFAAAVIGGIALEGGRGRMFGAFTGVVLLGLVQNILVLSQIQTF
jgi:simple sugar transport system permease protein